MKGLIVFESSHGCTEKCAGLLKGILKFETDLLRLRDNPSPDLSSYDMVIIGGSIHTGIINRRIKKFCDDYVDILKTKKLGLYMCCMHEGEIALQQFKAGFLPELRDHAIAKGFFGGEFNFSKMNIFEKAIIKKVAKVEDSISKIREDEIILFAEKINNAV